MMKTRSHGENGERVRDRTAARRYADVLGALLDAVSTGSLPSQSWRTADEEARWLHYNVYTVPWRTFEVQRIVAGYFREGTRGCRILDAGCGLGAVGLYLALDGEASSVIGLDQQISLLQPVSRLARALGLDEIRFIRGDLAHPSVRDESFDLVISSDNLHYCSLPKLQALRRMRESLRPGGIAVIKTVNRLYPPYALLSAPGVRGLAQRLPGSGLRSKGFVHPTAPTSVGLSALLVRAGFSGVTCYNRKTGVGKGVSRWFMPMTIVVAQR